jgi:hypothetical protein
LDNQPSYLHSSISGELWVKLNNQIALPATNVLGKTFEQFAGILSTEAYQDFYNNNIQMVNCYFDTLFLKTPNIAIFTNLLFDYGKQEIETIFDDTRWILLNKYTRFEKNWFFPSEKRVVILVTKFQEINANTIFYPCLYELDLVTKNLKIIFELNPNEIRKIYFKDKVDCSFSYEGGHNKFLITYSGISKNTDKLFLLDYYITNEPICKLHKCSLYEDLSDPNQIITPPFVTYNYLTAYSVVPNVTFNIKVPVLNTFEGLNILNNTNVVASVSSNIITFTGKVTAGLHHINYNLKNEAGESNYCLTVNSFS